MNFSNTVNSILKLTRAAATVNFGHCIDDERHNTESNNIAVFHVVAKDGCWLHCPKLAEPIALNKGDLILFPRNDKHLITDTKTIRSFNDEPHTDPLMCGIIEFELLHFNPLLNSLPSSMIMSTEPDQETPWLNQIIMLMLEESEVTKKLKDTNVVINRLSEMLFIYLLRYELSKSTNSDGFIAALRDSRISKALAAFHESPGLPWTVETLADKANLSRATFSSLFSKLLDKSPMQYVTHWRMQIALVTLRETDQSIIEIAESIGYRSESSFHKAFKQTLGITPGTVREADYEFTHVMGLEQKSDLKKKEKKAAKKAAQLNGKDTDTVEPIIT